MNQSPATPILTQSSAVIATTSSDLSLLPSTIPHNPVLPNVPNDFSLNPTILEMPTNVSMPDVAPSTSTSSSTYVPPPRPAELYLSSRFCHIYNRFCALPHSSYQSAYNHYLCELYVQEITHTLGIQAGGANGGVSVENGVVINRDIIASWLGMTPVFYIKCHVSYMLVDVPNPHTDMPS